jgi:transcriptional regulator with XRE-family HTH domain
MELLLVFGERLKELMFDRNITAENLSRQLGVSSETVRLWKNGKRYISLSLLIKLADCLDCSIEYLAGRSNTVLDFIPKNCPPFYIRLREVMKEKQITRYNLVKNTNIYDSYFSNWKNGSDVNILTLIRLADYLDCSIDYLVGRNI